MNLSKTLASTIARSSISIAILAVILPLSPLSHAETKEWHHSRMQELSDSITLIKRELAAKQASKETLQAALQTSEEDIAAASKKIIGMKEALAREKKQLKQLQTQRAQLITHKNTQQHYIIEIIQHYYQLGQQSQLKLLLNQENPQKISQLLTYHTYIIDAHQRKIAAYSQTINKINQLESSVASVKKQLALRYQSLADRQRALQQVQKQRLKTLRKVNRSLQEKGKRLAVLSRDKRQLQDLLDNATNALANLNLLNGNETFAKTKGKLPLPTKGTILHRYGSAQFDGKLKRTGIFIRNKAGAKVISVHHGRVIFSSYFNSHGLLLIVDHGNGYMSLYGHNQTLLKETGDWVEVGETIATIGDSGGQALTGLYFEIRYQGRPQNPQHWLM